MSSRPATSSASNLPDHVRALLDARTYPHPVTGVELVQTHVSYVFLAGEQVYKLKKAVDLGFVDFTTLEKRRAACEAEVRLNQRGCPGGIYIGVVPVRLSAGVYHLGGEGETVDYAVHMKRLPAEGMMDSLLARGEVGLEMIGRVTARLAEMHRDADRGEAITAIGGYEQHLRNWRQNLDGIRPFIGSTLSQARFDRIEAAATRMLDRNAALLRRREQQGWVRDCHGDLRSDAVCFDPRVPGGICIYDCVEFNDAFRYSDTALDAAFLAMDLDYRGRRDLSDLFIGLYAAAADDPEVALLQDLFKCYRAVVRGKVESLLLDDRGVDRRQKAAARRRAKAYFALAESYTRRRRRRTLVLVTGPSGSGKSVLGGSLAARLGAALVSTDMVRRTLFAEQGRGAPLDTGIYTASAREQVYDAVLGQAESYLRDGRSVVVDGTYIERARRQPVEALVARPRARLLVVECSAPDDVVRERQQRRQGEPWTASEGRWEVYQRQKALLEPATEVAEHARLAVDTTVPLAEQIATAEARLRLR